MYATLRSAAVSGLAFLSLAGHAAGQTITLDVTATPSIFTTMFEGFAAAFETENPDIRINLDTSQRDGNDLLQATLRQALVDQLPDVTFQYTNYLRTLAEAGITVPLDDFVVNDPAWTEDMFSPSVTASGTVGDTVHGLGVAISFPIIYYNADLVAAARNGVATLPGDWDGILDVAGRIEDGNPGVLGLFVRYHPWVFQGLLGSFGGRVMSADETAIRFTGAAGQDVLTLLRRFGEAGQAEHDMSRSQARQAFLSGSVAILIDSSSSLANFEQQTEGSFRIGTAQLPLIADDAWLPAAGIAAVMVTRDAARQEAAWRFMRFVASPEGQAIVALNSGFVPANHVATERPDILGDYYADRPNAGAALSSIPIAVTWYAFPGENAGRIDRAIEDRLREVVTLRQDPDAAMAALEDDVQSLLPN